MQTQTEKLQTSHAQRDFFSSVEAERSSDFFQEFNIGFDRYPKGWDETETGENWQNWDVLEQWRFLTEFGVEIEVLERDAVLERSPALLDSLRRPREQFKVAQDQVDQNEMSAQRVWHLQEQVESHLREHALNQQVKFGQYVIERGERGFWDLFSPTHRDIGSFLESTYRSFIDDPGVQQYFKEKYGRELTSEEKEFFMVRPQALMSLFSEQFLHETRAGLELAEYLGLWEMAQQAGEATEKDIVTIFSPDSEYRQTPEPYQWTNVIDVTKDSEQKKHLRIMYIKSKLPFEEYVARFASLAGNEGALETAQAVVRQAVLLKDKDLEYMVRYLDAAYSKTVQVLFDQAIWEHRKLKGVVVKMLANKGIYAPEAIQEKLLELEQLVVNSHQRLVREFYEELNFEEQRTLDFSAEGYLRGAACGLALNSVGFSFGAPEFGNPMLEDRWVCEDCGAIHHIQNGDSSTYFHACEFCGASGYC